MIKKNNIFFTTSKFDFKIFFKFIPKKKGGNTIIDFGCGQGIWSKNNINNSQIKKIKLYDKNKSLISLVKEKYQKFDKITYLDKLCLDGDILLMNSTLQYIDDKEWNILSKKIFSRKSKLKIIIISDIPKFPRFIEALILCFLNPKRFFLGLKLIFEKEYLKLNFYYKKLNQININNKLYFVIKYANLNDEGFTRYSLIFSNKKLFDC